MRKLASLALLALLASPYRAAAAPWIVDAERGNAIQAYALGAALFERRDVQPRWNWQLDRLWVARASYWTAEHPQPYGKHLWDFSLMPTLRLAPRHFDTLQPFVEAAVGAHVLSATAIDNRPFSTAFQFGERLAVGVRFPGRIPVSIGVGGEHVSNGGIKEPNSGVTFAALRVQLEWR